LGVDVVSNSKWDLRCYWRNSTDTPSNRGDHGSVRLDRDACFGTSQRISVRLVARGDRRQNHPKVAWMNPHVYFTVRKTDSDGAALEQQVHVGSASALIVTGVPRGALAVGERKSARAYFGSHLEAEHDRGSITPMCRCPR
jgi:hypothetical protein